MDGATDAIVIVTPNNEVLYANTAFCELFDCSLEKMNETGFGYVFVDRDIAEEICQAVLSLDTWTGETRMVSAKGRDFPAFLRCSPITDDELNVSGILLVIDDITDHKEMEEDIANLAKFPNENPNPVLRISKDGEILYANGAGIPLLDAWECKEDGHLPEPQCKLIEEVLSSGKTSAFELNCRDLVFSVTMVPTAEAGYVNVYGFDITELKLS